MLLLRVSSCLSLIASLVLAAASLASASDVVVHVRSHGEDPTVVLNRFTFTGNVKEGLGDAAQNWVVFFTSLSSQEGAQLVPSFRVLAGGIAKQLNGGRLFSSSVKFAIVDCSVDKELCSEQSVEDHHPSLVHFRDGAQIAQWRSKSGTGMLPWLRLQLMGGPLPAKMRREEAPAESSPAPSGGEGGEGSVEGDSEEACDAEGAGGEADILSSDRGGEQQEQQQEEESPLLPEELEDEELQGSRGRTRGLIERLQRTSFPPAMTCSLVLGVVGISFWIVLQEYLSEDL